jgi:hypothetical protein
MKRNLIKLIEQSCCLFSRDPAENSTIIPEYKKIILEYDDGSQKTIFKGDKWNENDFEKKKFRSG